MIKYKFVEISLGVSSAIVASEAPSEVSKAIANITGDYFDLTVEMGKIGYKPSGNTTLDGPLYSFVKEYNEIECVKISLGGSIDMQVSSLNEASNNVTVEIAESINNYKGWMKEDQVISLMLNNGWRIVCATPIGYIFER